MQVKSFNNVLLALTMVILSACNDKICPAYSSYFILDNSNRDRIEIAYNTDAVPDESYNLFSNEIRDSYFSYMKDDSLPKEVEVNKTWYGTIKKQNLNKRNKALQTIPMEVVINEVDDSTLFAGDETMYAEMEVDSAKVDSLVAANAKTYKYNVDQKYYNWYFRDKLVWKDELDTTSVSEDPQALDENLQEQEVPDSLQTQKKGLFKGGLFGKKKKKGSEDEAAVENQEEENQPPPDNNQN